MKRLWTFVYATSSLSVGFGVAVYLVCLAELPGLHLFLSDTILDPTRWTIAHRAVSKDATLFAILIAGNFLTIFLSLIFFQMDMMKSGAETTMVLGHRSRLIGLAHVVNIVAIFVNVFWMGWFLLTVVNNCQLCESAQTKFDLDKFLGVSSVIALVIFVLFFIEDYFLGHVSHIAIKKLEKDLGSTPGDEKLKLSIAKMSSAKRMAFDSVWLIDFPAVVASLGIIAYAMLYPHLNAVGNGLTEAGSKTVFPDINWGLKAIPSLKDPAFAISQQVSLGLSAGAHLMQLLISQVIFAVLNLRLQLERKAEE